jgi:hypothetical protein
LRPRLAFLARIVGDLAARRRSDATATARPAQDELRSAEEVKRRLDETRTRLKRAHEPPDDR